MVLTIYETSFSQKVVTLSIPQDIRPTLEKQYLPLQEISLSQGSAYPTNVLLRINGPTDVNGQDCFATCDITCCQAPLGRLRLNFVVYSLTV
ncbi:MAG: hypothetical protein EZS28_016033 [Streblomastix strix]|uniref:Uncharacterized protein n=1 Tax=Streblomastix strix TaxID=222440 RepID=A0A5J4W1C2_9EUKA|nr:MAG: hypothetical protein EZS28_016033 [Streblomastix strix]